MGMLVQNSADLMVNNYHASFNSQKTNERDLMEKFGRYGPLASVKIMWPRTEEERQRGANCGFVAFMSRKDAENALSELDGTSIDGVSLRLSWSKYVALPSQPIYIPPHLIGDFKAPPQSGLPFNAQPKRQINEVDLHKVSQVEIQVFLLDSRPPFK
jgi:U2-associated protein SR140